MKKKLSAILTAIMLVLCFARSAGAINVIMNSSFVRFPDQEPVVENGVTLVPVRPIAEALGLEVGWDEPKQLVTLKGGSFFIELTIGSDVARTSSGEKKLSAAPKIIGERTMVPLRFIAETMGLTVLWSDEYQRVIINGKIDTSSAVAAEKSENAADSDTASSADTSITAASGQQTEEEELPTEDEGAYVSVTAASSAITFELPDSFAYDDTDSEESFAYRAVDATDIQHLYDWSIVSLYESYADSSLTNGILIVVQDLEPYDGEDVDVSRINEEYPAAPEKPDVNMREMREEADRMMIEQIFAERGVEMPDDAADLDREALAALLGFESEEEYKEYAASFAEGFDMYSVPGYAEYMEYMNENSAYSLAYNELKSIKTNAVRNFSSLSSQVSDEAWAALFSEQLNTDSEVRYDGVEILTIDDKKIVHATIYAEDPDDEQGTFDCYIYYDGDCRVTIYGGTLYGTEASPEAVDVLSRMKIQ